MQLKCFHVTFFRTHYRPVVLDFQCTGVPKLLSGYASHNFNIINWFILPVTLR